MSASRRTGSLKTLPDHELLRRLAELLARDRHVEADVLVHLGEVDARELYLEEGFDSMFRYCVEGLHLSEGTAYHRIHAARVARRHPLVLDRIRRGEIHLSGVILLARHLTERNCAELLGLARHRSKRDIEELLADRAPKPDAPSIVRRLPIGAAEAKANPTSAVASSDDQRTDSPVRAPDAAPLAVPAASPPERPAFRPPEPLGCDRFKIQFTASRELREKLQEAQALLRHQIPDGDMAEIFNRALALLIADARRKKFAATEHPAARRGTSGNGRRATRHIPAEIKRAVAARDAGRCAFVGQYGRRCGSRDFLEFHHTDAWSKSKRHSIDGIELRCRGHNHHAAVKDYGVAHMARFRSHPRNGAPS